MIKVLLITPRIPVYRYEVYRQLGVIFDLTVLHSGSQLQQNGATFKEIVLPIKRLGPLTYFSKSLNKLCQDYEVVVSEANIRHIDRDILILNRKRKYKWIAWGIGVSASYDKKFDENKSLDWIRHRIFRKADANIFYSEYPLAKYLNAGFKRESLFVAHNTTHVEYNEDLKFTKSKLLFVGTLYKQKRIYELLVSYKTACSMTENTLPLVIIGGGPEYEAVKSWIAYNKMQKKIVLTGPVFEPEELERHFREAYACISPGQAGLSVLSSMGYGTPFITISDAITGGEIFNIRNGENGILYYNNEDLKDIILDIFNKPEMFIEMGNNARKHYMENRQVKGMVKSLTDAVFYVLN